MDVRGPNKVVLDRKQDKQSFEPVWRPQRDFKRLGWTSLLEDYSALEQEEGSRNERREREHHIEIEMEEHRKFCASTLEVECLSMTAPRCSDDLLESAKPESREVIKRKRLSIDDKVKIIAEHERGTNSVEIGAMLIPPRKDSPIRNVIGNWKATR
jgi:hypothetical protein